MHSYLRTATAEHVREIFDLKFALRKPKVQKKTKTTIHVILKASPLVLKPRLLLCGYSSYPRDLDYAQFKSIADEVGAYTMADISHYGGLVAGNAMANPLDAGFDVVTTTTHKSLRGPRGGLILCRSDFAKAIDSSVFPGLQGGPHMNLVAAVAVTLKHAASKSFA